MKLFTTHNLGLFKLPIESLEWDKLADITTFGTEAKIREYTDNLKTDIRANGLQKPVSVSWHLTKNLGDKFKVTKGHHRVQAMSELGYKTVKCNVVLYEYKDTEYLIRGLKWLTSN